LIIIFGKGKKMKTNYWTILILAVVTAVLFTAPLPCRAAEKEKENIWLEDEPERRHRLRELTDERIERMMVRLAETDAEKAKELEQMRKEDPEKFKTELRKVMREHFGKRFRERREERFAPSRVPGMPGMRRMRSRRDTSRRPSTRKHEQLMDWLEENYPEKAKELAELKEERPELYWKKLGLCLRKYGRIAEAAEENPKLAAVLKEDLGLKQQRDALLEKLETAGGDEKQELIAELEEVVSSRFDLIVERKQIEYEQLLKRLEKLKEKVKQSEAEVEKWKVRWLF